MKKYKNPKLAVAWYYDSEDTGNFATFVYDDKKNTDIYKEFLKFANKYNKWGVKDKDIIDVFTCGGEEDCFGRDYKIIVK